MEKERIKNERERKKKIYRSIPQSTPLNGTLSFLRTNSSPRLLWTLIFPYLRTPNCRLAAETFPRARLWFSPVLKNKNPLLLPLVSQYAYTGLSSFQIILVFLRFVMLLLSLYNHGLCNCHFSCPLYSSPMLRFTLLHGERFWAWFLKRNFDSCFVTSRRGSLFTLFVP